MSELISVVIPAYNVSRFIGRAVQSVLKQTYGNIEIIVVDDSSTDETEKTLREYQGRIRYIRHEINKGAAEARNTGIAACRGELIAFLDGDDLWAPEKLELFAEAFSLHPDAMFAFSDFSRFEWEDESFFALSNSQIYPEIYPLIERRKYRDRRFFLIPRTDMFKLLLGGYPIFPTAIAVRRSLFDSIGMWRKVRTNEDFDFGLRSCRVTDSIYIDEKLAMVGRHDANLTLDIRRQMEGNLAVFDLHLSDPGYSVEEIGLIRHHKGRRLCGLGYSYHRSGDYRMSLRKYREAMRYDKWFWHAVTRMAFVSLKRLAGK